MLVASSSTAPFQHGQPLAWLRQVADQFTGIRVEQNGARRYRDHKVLAITARHLGRSAVDAILGLELFILPKGGKRIQRGLDLEDDVAAFAAVAAIGSPPWDKLLAVEVHH